MKMVMLTVYEKPKDYPNEWVIREHILDEEGIPHVGDLVYKTQEGMEAVRKHHGEKYPDKVITQRHPQDDPCIVETWI